MSVDLYEAVFRMHCNTVCGRVWYGRWADASAHLLRSHEYCCRGKAISIKCFVCVCVCVCGVRYPAC
jgi:hypothetical protein